MAAKTPQNLRAVVDVGSSSMTMKIAKLSRNKPPKILETLRGNLALGIDAYNAKFIRESNIDRCCEILQNFSMKLDEYGLAQSDCRVIATSALREAQNRQYVIMRIAQDVGFKVEVLDNSIERYYHNMAISETLPEFPKLIEEGALILDIGSGSIQVSAFKDKDCLFSQNLLLGVLRVTEMLGSLREQTKDYVSLMNEYVDSEINDFHILEGRGMDFSHLIALSPGTAYLKQLADLSSETNTVDSQQLEEIYQALQRKSPLQMTLDRNVPTDIAEILLPTGVIIHKYADYNDLKEIYMPQADVLDGILIEMATECYRYKPNYDHMQDTISNVRNLARRFRCDEPHINFVEDVSLKVFDAIKFRFHLTPRHRLLLQLGSLLHDIGKFIHMNHHSHRSFNIINFIEIIGITEKEREIVAWISRMHSSTKLPGQEMLGRMSWDIRFDVLRLAAILRLADALDAAHRQKFVQLDASVSKNDLILRYATNEDITLERTSLKCKGQMFKSVYGMTPVLKPKRK